MTAVQRERALFVVAVAGLWALLVVQAWQTPALLDDWVQRAWYRRQPFSLGLLVDVARYNHGHFNPRVGDLFLLLVNGPIVVHLIVTPLAQLALLWLTFAIALGRWPRATYADLAVLAATQALIWLASPLPGLMYFYRPYTTNYLFAFATTLALAVPYRLALARAPRPGRWWAVPAMLALGWLAGMSNEHTGPTALVVLVGFVIHAARARRLRACAWMIAGALGLAIGYAMLLLAPGQAERYAGRAAKFDALGLIVSRGWAGNFEIVAGVIAEAQWAIYPVVAAVLGFVAWHRRRDLPLPAIAERQLAAIAVLIAAAGAITVTLFASPVTTERLLFASTVLIVGALVVVVDYLCAAPAARRWIALVGGAIVVYHAARFLQVYAVAHADFARRVAILDAAHPGSVVIVPPYRQKRSRWFWGDDFKLGVIREQVAHEVYDLAAIEYEPRPTWAEPSPVQRFVARWSYAPPLSPALAAAHPAPRYTPLYIDAMLGQLRKQRALSPIAGHVLVRYEVDVVDPAFVDPRRRPLRALVWTPDAVHLVDGERYEDAERQLWIRLWRPGLPAAWTESYIVGCGRTQAVTPRPGAEAGAEANDLLLPLGAECRGSYAAVVCEPTVCWLAGRSWR